MKADFPLYAYYGLNRIRGIFYSLVLRRRYYSLGRACKIFGNAYFDIGTKFSMGDFCWVQAISRYKGVGFKPKLLIGNNVSFSDFVHVSCVHHISIGSGTLVGSCVYIGDHSHGRGALTTSEALIAPAQRMLDDVKAINIGQRVWIGDGAKILAGADIADGCIIAANAVVKGRFQQPGLIAGSPATLKRVFSND